MNAKVETDNTGREMVMGTEGLGTRNENGELYTDFCANNDLVIGVPFSYIETSTRRPGDHQTWQQRMKLTTLPYKEDGEEP
ncbi:hypothetical protein DPMN_071890 [Dreissena polymorpha]|uniref:Uncharacterized protein n=1 Tax=Dreissena polymorpha TaxID=45954 RepID=A0A9D3Z5I4_DREPO|nr:hypothetical protein DPMN_071890 [Dreissena polymorpha]